MVSGMMLAYSKWLGKQFQWSKHTKKHYFFTLTKINLESVDTMLFSLSELRRTDADKTFKGRITSLRTFSRFLKEEYPSSKLIDEIDKLKQIKNITWNPHKPYSMIETKKILENAVGWRKQCLYIAFNSGLRKNEIRRLNVDDIDLVHNWIHVRKGKGNKYRKVGIADKVPLERWLKFKKLTHTITDNIGDPWLFTRNGTRPNLTAGSVFKALSDKIGIKITLHRCRATYATELYRQTRDSILVKEQLGHTSLETTNQYIQQFSHERVEKIKKIGRLF